MTPVEQFIRIVKDGGASVVCTSMIDADIRAFYRRPWVMVASDGGIGERHPRGAGTFPRVLGRYVREQQWLTLPEAIRKMTSAPAGALRLDGRGRIEPGAIADRRAVQSDRRSSIARRSRDPGGAAVRRREGVRRRRAGVGRRQADRRAAGEGADVRPHAGRSRRGRVPPGAGWGQLPAGLQYGEVPGMTIDAAGRVFAFHRDEPPVIEFDAAGKVLKTWGEKMFVWPHGIRVDRDGFLWITDGRARRRQRSAGVQVHARRASC